MAGNLMGGMGKSHPLIGLNRADQYGRELSWKRNAANNAMYKKMVENILMGQESQLGVMQDTYPQYADILQGGYRSATGTTQAGLQQSINARVGGDPDLGFLDYQPQQQPDLSFLKDFKMPDFNVKRPDLSGGYQGESSWDAFPSESKTATGSSGSANNQSFRRLMEG